MFRSPLDQFMIDVISPIWVPVFGDISLTNAALYLILSTSFFIFSFYFVMRTANLLPFRFQIIVEDLYKIVLEMVKQQLGRGGLAFFPIIYYVFGFLIFSNLFGLFPFSFTPTSHVIMNFTLALAFNLSFIFWGFFYHGLKFLKLFVPAGSPAFLLPLIVVIEVLSYLIRTFSLSIRLFANMMAGHTLLFILASFVVAFYNAKFYILSLFPFIMVLAVFGLEIGIAMLQAYVFAILLCIYYNDSLHPSH
jgi:F-type H+-transporting ATPase subunit a